ncbi:MAG: hypothetical protein GY715_07945 [Planctomycetes bacterium]|nr:hypothetical protein [Planctomycetota bacterium]
MTEPRRAGTVRPYVRFAVGVALLAAAAALLWSRRGDLAAAFEAAQAPRLGDVAGLLACVVANVVLTAAYLRLILSRYGRVGGLEMQAVIAVATLMNYLPMRPGMFGRIAYHRRVNGIPVASTARSIVEAAGLSAAIALFLAAVAAISAAGGWSLWYGVAIPLAPLIAGAWWFRRTRWLPAALLRYLEVLVWALRYHLAFAIIGTPVSPTAALAFACVGVIATMVPVVGNGLGLREWAIGLLAPFLAAAPLEIGVTADLVNRGAELIVIGTLGCAGLWWLSRRTR